MRPFVAATALSLASCGGPLFSAEVEIDRFCFSQPQLSVPGVPGGGTVTLLAADVPVPLPPTLASKGELVVRLDDVTVTATTPGTDLSGITSLRVEEQTAAGPRVVAVYTRPANPHVPLGAIVAQGQGVDIADAAKSGRLRVMLTVSGTPPTASWTAGLELCAYGKSVISYL
jgi:hypothetical protein